MALIKTIFDKSPMIDETCFLAEDAVITGDVTIGKESGIWYNVVIRGDVCKIIIGERTNIQDHSMIHGSYGKSETMIGDDVTIGHRAIIHGCRIANNVLVGMGAIILDNAIVEDNVIVGAGSVVLENARLESGYLYAGIPAKKIKKLDMDRVSSALKMSADAYVQLGKEYKK